jgi:hypothetical protein
MGHPDIENQTAFAFEPLFLNDEVGRSLLVPLVKATYGIQNNQGLTLAEDPVPINLEGECRGDPESGSYKYEPEAAFVKPSTDVILIGHAHARGPNVTELNVTLKVGRLGKAVRVFGDRYWLKSLGMAGMTDPRPFSSIPLIFEKAFGGWDRSHPDPEKHSFEPRNPVGMGYMGKKGKFEEGRPLPNLEDPRDSIRRLKDKPAPAGFGFLSPNWQPRLEFAGTYDEAWKIDRMPFLPQDFNRRFFNAAPQDQIYPGYLHGNESVVIDNASPQGHISFQLPGVRPPQFQIQLRGTKDQYLSANLDTLVIDTDDNRVFLTWRCFMPLRNGPQDVVAVKVFNQDQPVTSANTKTSP